MKALIPGLLAFSIVFWFAGVIVALASLVFTVGGIILAFKASIILGLISLIPVFAIVNIGSGIAYIFADKNLPEIIQAWVNFPF